MSSVIYRSYSGRLYQTPANSGPVRSILTYPLTDYAGDYVRPDGGDWSEYPSNPLVNWTHETPIGRGSVTHKSLKLNNETTTVAVGETQFFQKAADLKGIDLTRRETGTYRPIGRYSERECLETAEQVERLVRDDIATGVSVEFKAIDYRELPQRSVLENRNCRHVERWKALAYAHAMQPVNAGARTLLTAAPEVQEKAARILSINRINGQAIQPVILKALQSIAPRASTRTTVRIENKAMDELSDMPPTQDSVAQDEEIPGAPTDGPTPAVRTLLDGAQMLLDLGEQLTQSISQSEHKKARKYVAKIIEELTATAEEMNGMAEKVKAELDDEPAEPSESDDSADEADEPSEVDEDSEEEVEVEAKAITRRDDGSIICKSFPNWKPRRFTVDALSEPAPKQSANNDDPVVLRALQREVAKAKREAKAYLRAAAANGKV